MAPQACKIPSSYPRNGCSTGDTTVPFTAWPWKTHFPYLCRGSILASSSFYPDASWGDKNVFQVTLAFPCPREHDCVLSELKVKSMCLGITQCQVGTDVDHPDPECLPAPHKALGQRQKPPTHCLLELCKVFSGLWSHWGGLGEPECTSTAACELGLSTANAF